MVSLARRCMQVSFRVGTPLNLFLVSFFMIMIIIIIFFYYSSSFSSFTRIWKVDDAVKEEKDHVARDSVSVQKRRERHRGEGKGGGRCRRVRLIVSFLREIREDIRRREVEGSGSAYKITILPRFEFYSLISFYVIVVVVIVVTAATIVVFVIVHVVVYA